MGDCQNFGLEPQEFDMQKKIENRLPEKRVGVSTWLTKNANARHRDTFRQEIPEGLSQSLAAFKSDI